jgi:hypothetical protein
MLRLVLCVSILGLAAFALSFPTPGPPILLNPRDMSPMEMLTSASHVFVGVIQKHKLERSFAVVASGDRRDVRNWMVMRREVLIEAVLLGSESRKVVDVYEVFWTAGASGDWNSTHDDQRVLLLLRVERGRYRVVRDWWRSIFPVTTGRHTRLPGAESLPFWERIALMNWWVERSDDTVRIAYPYFHYSDPGGALSLWRRVKLERGLVRHPSAAVRVAACRELLQLTGWGQDECWDTLSEADRAHLHDSGYVCCSGQDIAADRSLRGSKDASWWWSEFLSRDERRILTTINHIRLRTELCRLYNSEYPGDLDTGCPATKPPPATIVTEQGDIPLLGPWPR